MPSPNALKDLIPRLNASKTLSLTSMHQRSNASPQSTKDLMPRLNASKTLCSHVLPQCLKDIMIQRPYTPPQCIKDLMPHLNA